MAYVVGVDGCQRGWVATPFDVERGLLSPRVYPSFRQLIADFDTAAAIGVDIPIGLGIGKARFCDSLARKMLKHRHMTVFTPPARLLIEELFGENAPIPEYEVVNPRSKQIASQGISRQAYAICPKIAEVDRAMSAELQERVVEVHPEVSFCALAGRPLDEKKKSLAGYDERRRLLTVGLGVDIWSRSEASAAAPGAGPDDLLDAAAAAWTARNVYWKTETRLTGEPNRDTRGLRMEIVY
jgi:predicted RNase H-like nuclease